MSKQVIAFIVVAFLAGFGAGYATRREKSGVDTINAAPAPAMDATNLPAGHPPIGGMSANEAPPQEEMPAPQTEAESKAIAGMQRVQAGQYAAAMPLLAEAAADKDLSAPVIRIFQAIAAEGAGQTPKAKSFLKSDSDVEVLRSIAKEAFMQHQDYNIAGPAYQLYLKMRPNDPSRPMMENAVKVWTEGQK